MAYTGSKAQSGRGSTIGIGPAAGTVPPTGITGTTTSGSPNITAASSIVGVVAGLSVSGTGIAPGTTVVSASGTTIVMSQNATGAGTGTALTFAIGYTTIGELKQADMGKPTFDKEDVSNFQSNIDKEFQKEMRDNGTPKFSGNRVGSDAGQLAALAAFNDPNNSYLFSVTLPLAKGQTTTGDTYTFSALVMSASFGPVEANKSVPFDMELQITGPITFTAGS